MHLLKYNPDAKTLTEVPPSEFDADPTCRYFYVLGNRAHVPIVTPDGIGEIVWEHPSYQPPKPANQHAHIEAKAAEAGARRAVEQMRSRPGSWQPIKTETTYGSDATTPELSQSDVKAAEMEGAHCSGDAL